MLRLSSILKNLKQIQWKPVLFLPKGLAHNMLIDSINPLTRKKGETDMNIFYIVGVIVVVMFVAGFLGLR